MTGRTRLSRWWPALRGKVPAAVLDDVTALRRDNAMLARMFETSLDLLLVADRRGTYLRVSPSCYAILGYRPAEMVGRSGREFLHPDDLARTRDEMRLARRGREMRNFQTRYLHKDGHVVALAWTGVWCEPEQQHYFIGRDIAELRRAEELKDEFVSTVSHELRTPLTAIAASLALLRKGVYGELPAAAARLVEIAGSNGERLVRLVNDILDIEKLGSGGSAFNIQTIDLRSVVEGAIDGAQTLAAQSGVRLRLTAQSTGDRVEADPDRLTQVLTNLLSNAILFSPAGEEVIVTIARGDRIRVAVRDHGPGIPDDFKPRIFERFAQARTRGDRRKGGTGLGLSIVKEIISRLGGEVGFDSAAGRGTLFWFELPLCQDQGAQDAPPLELKQGAA